MSGDDQTFSLRAIVRDVLHETGALTPEAVAVEVRARIAASDVEEALQQALVEVARRTLVRERHAPIEPVPTPPTAESARPNRSRYQAAIRAHAAALYNRTAVGGGTYKLLRDCTFDDLQHAAEVRERMAHLNAAKAAQYRTLAELLRESGAATVGDLTEAQLRTALDDAA